MYIKLRLRPDLALYAEHDHEMPQSHTEDKSTVSMLNSTEHEISTAQKKTKILKNYISYINRLYVVFCVFYTAKNVKMLTQVLNT